MLTYTFPRLRISQPASRRMEGAKRGHFPGTSVSELLDFICVQDVPRGAALVDRVATRGGHQDTDGQAVSPLYDSIVRRNIADRLVDEACAFLLSPSGLPEESWYVAESLLLKSLLLASDFVNAYYWLGEGYRRQHAETSPYEYLMHHWGRYGGGSASALHFIQQYQHDYPYQLSVQLQERLGTDTVLVLHISDDMRFLDLLEYDGGRQYPLAFIGRIERPHLLCTPRDFRMLPAAKQTIAEDLVKRGKDTRVVMHRGTCVQGGHRSVFGPAVDTVYYNRVLHEVIYGHPTLMEAITTVVEIGTGSGFLLCSIIRALRYKWLRVLASDINPHAIEVARANIARTVAESHGRTDMRAPEVSLQLDGQLLNSMADGSVDLLFSNPPYIPSYRQMYAANPYEGTQVLEDVLLGSGPRVLSSNGIIIMLYSSLTVQAMQHYLRQSPLVAVPLAAALRVPLDLREINHEPHWLRFLHQHPGLDVDFTNPDYVYWHTLHMVGLCHPHNRQFLNTVGHHHVPRRSASAGLELIN
jgi:hypothetical protein